VGATKAAACSGDDGYPFVKTQIRHGHVLFRRV